jgi:hypothetical protein
MKKFKKLLSMLLATTMVCGFNAVPALAEGQDPVAGRTGDGDTALTELDFKKILVADSGTTLPVVEFSFNMVPDSSAKGTVDGYTLQPGPSLTNSTVTYAVNENSSITEDSETGWTGVVINGKFDLSGLFTTTDTGMYRYTVSEDTSDTQKEKYQTINYDESKTYIVDLYVKEGDIIYIQARDIGVNGDDKGENTLKPGTKAPIIFKNSLTTISVKIKKIIEGKMANATTPYDFQIKIPAGGDAMDLNAGTKIKYHKEDANGQKIAGSDSTFTVGGEKTDDKGWNDFTLKANESIVLDGITAGMILDVKEDAKYASEGYTTSWVLTTNGNVPDEKTKFTAGNDTGWVTTVKGGTNTVTFKNAKEIADTGIVLDIMPYVVVVLLAAGCAVLLIAKKRRNAR